MVTAVLASRFDRATLDRNADWLAMAVAASLPWSTTATGILVTLWLIALLPTLELAHVRREIFSPAGGLPVLLVLAGLLGMAWADVGLDERLHGFKSFLKLLMIPLLLAQFRRSDRGMWVLGSFFASCALLLFASFVSLLLPQPDDIGTWGVPAKNYISQSIEFAICAFAAAWVSLDAARSGRPGLAVAALAAGLAFLADIFYVATGRTALVIVAVLLLLFALRHFRWKGMLVTLLLGGATAAVLWVSSPYLRDRVEAVWEEVDRYRSEGIATSAGFRLEFWKKSVEIMERAPLVGHGTGSIRDQFRRAATGEDGMSAITTANPHNQTLTVGIQLGLLGIAALYAMWLGHLLLFRGPGLASWIGLVIVVQNVIGSMFNSHLFDFTEGWIYVFLVGAAGGIVLKGGGPSPAPGQRAGPGRLRPPPQNGQGY